MSEIIIDPSVLQERTDIYSSLTDINGASVFTDAYEEKVHRYELKNQSVYNSIKGDVFVKNTDNGNDAYDKVQSELFTKKDTQVVKGTASREGNSTAIAVPIIGIVCVFVTILLVRYVNKRRRKWEENETDTYAYE